MSQKGQALIILIVAIAIALLILTSALLRSVGQAKNSARSKLSGQVFFAAETGVEYGLIKLMRDPTGCTGNDNLNLDGIAITITYNVSGPNCLLNSEAVKNNIKKKVQVSASYNTSWVFNYSDWSEIP